MWSIKDEANWNSLLFNYSYLRKILVKYHSFSVYYMMGEVTGKKSLGGASKPEKSIEKGCSGELTCRVKPGG